MPEAPIPKTPPANAPSQIQTAPPFVAFNPSNVPPTQSTYLQLNDTLFIRSISNFNLSGVTVNYRYLTPQGEIKEGQRPIAPSPAVQVITIPLGEAWLLSIVILAVPSGFTAGAWAHAQIGILRGVIGGANPFYSVIWQGYLTGQNVNGWPGTPAKEAWDGSGTPRAVLGTLPAAGAEISEVVPANRRWQLLSLRAQLTTSVTVANRVPTFVIAQSGNTNFSAGTNVAQAASLVKNYCFTPGQTFYADIANNLLIPAPPTLILKAGDTITTSTTALQATDQWTPPSYEILEWASYDA